MVPGGSTVSSAGHFFQGDIVGRENNCLYTLYGPDICGVSNVMTSSNNK
jgi:hypothetical protein